MLNFRFVSTVLAGHRMSTQVKRKRPPQEDWGRPITLTTGESQRFCDHLFTDQFGLLVRVEMSLPSRFCTEIYYCFQLFQALGMMESAY